MIPLTPERVLEAIKTGQTVSFDDLDRGVREVLGYFATGAVTHAREIELPATLLPHMLVMAGFCLALSIVYADGQVAPPELATISEEEG